MYSTLNDKMYSGWFVFGLEKAFDVGEHFLFYRKNLTNTASMGPRFLCLKAVYRQEAKGGLNWVFLENKNF
jgi:hypothetical protein